MAELKTIRVKKLDNLEKFGVIEGRTYYVEENNTLYRDVLSTKMAVGQVYLAPKGIPLDEEEATLTLSNVLVISNEGDIDNDERDYKIGMYDENGEYIDLSTGTLIKNISLEGNDLVLTHENGTTTRIPLNELLTGVVKKINDKTPDSSGTISLSYNDLEDLPKLYDKDEIDDIVDNKVSEVDIMIGSVSVYTEEGPFAGFRNIDGHTLQESDTILVVGNGSNNGIYIVNKGGVWQRIQKVEKFQVVSIDNGIVYGGSMQKKMEDGITKMVKKPERSAWRVLI